MNLTLFANRISKYRKELMGLAALFILYFHTHACIWVGIWGMGTSEAFLKRILFFGVDIFMLLSGLGVVFSLRKNTLKQYFVNRVLRVYPPVIMMALLIKFHDKWTWLEFVKKASGEAFFEYMYSFLWFFTAILLVYFVAPLIQRIIIKCNNRMMFSLIFIVLNVLISTILDRGTNLQIWDYLGVWNRVPLFVFGMQLGNISLNSNDCTDCADDSEVFACDKLEFVFMLGCLVLGGFYAYVTCVEEKWLLVPNSNCFLPNIMLSISVCYLMTLLLDRMKMAKNFAKVLLDIISKILGFFGMISFELYVVQEWICGRLLRIISIEGRLNSMRFNIICFSVVLLSALLLYFLSQNVIKVIKKVCVKN